MAQATRCGTASLPCVFHCLRGQDTVRPRCAQVHNTIAPAAFCRCGQHLRAIYLKRFHYTRRDKAGICCSTILPVLILAAGLTSLSASLSQKTLTPLALDYTAFGETWAGAVPVAYGTNAAAPQNQMTAGLLSAQPYSPLDTSPTMGVSTMWGHEYTCGVPTDQMRIRVMPNESIPTFESAADCATNMSASTTSRHPHGHEIMAMAGKLLGEGGSSTVKDARFVAAISSDASAMISLLLNATATHAIPVALNALANTKAAAGTTIKVSSAPLPPTYGAAQSTSRFQNLVSVNFIVIAFSFVPGAVVAFVVKEREAARNSKHQQLISGVSVPGYWTATLLWDLTLYMAPLLLSLVLLYVYDLDAYKGVVCEDWTVGTPSFNPFAGLMQQTPGTLFQGGMVPSKADTCALATAAYTCQASLADLVQVTSTAFALCVCFTAFALCVCASLPSWLRRCPSSAAQVEDDPTGAVAAAVLANPDLQGLTCTTLVQIVSSIVGPSVCMLPKAALLSVVSSFDTAGAFAAAITDSVTTMSDLCPVACGGDYAANAAGIQNAKQICEESNADESVIISFDCEATMSQVCPVTCDECPYDRLFASFLLFLGYGVRERTGIKFHPPFSHFVVSLPFTAFQCLSPPFLDVSLQHCLKQCTVLSPAGDHPVDLRLLVHLHRSHQGVCAHTHTHTQMDCSSRFQCEFK